MALCTWPPFSRWTNCPTTGRFVSVVFHLFSKLFLPSTSQPPKVFQCQCHCDRAKSAGQSQSVIYYVLLRTHSWLLYWWRCRRETSKQDCRQWCYLLRKLRRLSKDCACATMSWSLAGNVVLMCRRCSAIVPISRLTIIKGERLNCASDQGGTQCSLFVCSKRHNGILSISRMPPHRPSSAMFIFLATRQ